MPSLCLGVAVLYLARDVLVPAALAILLAFLLTPAVTWLEHRHLGRILSIIIVVGASLTAIGGLTWVVEQQFVEFGAHLPNYRENIQDKWRRIRGASDSDLATAAKAVETTIKSVATTNPAVLHPKTSPASAPGSSVAPLIVQESSDPWAFPKMVEQYSGLVLSPLATMGLILVFVIFILVNRRDLRDRILRLVGDARLHLTTQALDDAATRITHYLLMQSAVNAVYGVCVGIGLWTIGAFSAEGRFPNVLLWALLATLLRFLPYLGSWIAAALPIMLSFVFFGNASIFLATVGMYVGLELVTANLLEPWLYASSTGLSAMAILASAVFWTWLWGPIGLLLSTPLTVCLVVMGKYVPHLQFLSVMLGDEQVLEPSVRTYQRLLSLDQEEAGELLQKYRKENGLQRVYEEVLIPALVLAERDRYSKTLDADREVFLSQAMRDLIDELGEAEKKQTPATAVADDSAVTILCLPAHSEADEIVGLMLAQLLALKGQRAIAVSQVSLAGEMLEMIQAQKAAVVCISALPPAAVSHSRYLCKRLKIKFPDLATVVGLWTSNADAKTSLERLCVDPRVRLATTVKQAVAELLEMVQPIQLQQIRADADTQAPAASTASTGRETITSRRD
jgi:predicted PurR-regulated permease PerM